MKRISVKLEVKDVLVSLKAKLKAFEAEHAIYEKEKSEYAEAYKEWKTRAFAFVVNNPDICDEVSLSCNYSYESVSFTVPKGILPPRPTRPSSSSPAFEISQLNSMIAILSMTKEPTISTNALGDVGKYL